MLFTAEHDQARRILQKLIETEINPHIDAWEEAGIYPAHQVSRSWGLSGSSD